MQRRTFLKYIGAGGVVLSTPMSWPSSVECTWYLGLHEQWKPVDFLAAKPVTDWELDVSKCQVIMRATFPLTRTASYTGVDVFCQTRHFATVNFAASVSTISGDTMNLTYTLSDDRHPAVASDSRLKDLFEHGKDLQMCRDAINRDGTKLFGDRFS